MLRVLLQKVQTKKQGRMFITKIELNVEIVQEKSFFCCVLKHFTHKFRVCKSCYSFVFSVVSILTNIGRFLHLNLAQVYVVGSGTNILQPAWQHQLKAGFIYTPRAIYSKGKKQVCPLYIFSLFTRLRKLLRFFFRENFFCVSVNKIAVVVSSF